MRSDARVDPQVSCEPRVSADIVRSANLSCTIKSACRAIRRIDSYSEQAIATLSKILEADPKAINTNFDLCLVFRIEAQACHGNGDDKKALTCVLQSIDYAEQLYAPGSGVERNESMMEELRDEKLAYEQALRMPQ
jgi:hypothetical protein